MVTAELRLLGPPALSIAGRPARLHSAKTLALLAYLVLEADRSHSREKLAALLWGESPDARARQSLRQALHSLRRALGRECLALAVGAVILEPPPDFWVDAGEFLSLVPADPHVKDLDALREAGRLYRGVLLEGLELSDCPAFDEWLFFRRDGLEQRAVGVLQALVDELLRRGEYLEAQTFARRLVTLDPLHEGAHRRLMRIYAALADRDGVRRQYRLCADVLADEMGIEPGTETQALYRQLITTVPGPRVSREPVTVPPPPGEQALELPFLGRERELAALQERLDQAVAGQGGLVLVSGEAGMGKTRLVAEFVRRSTGAAAPSVRCLRGQCYELEVHAPYTVWGDVLQPLSTPEWQPLLAGLAEVWRRQLARLVPELGPAADDLEGVTVGESRLRLLQGVVQALKCLTRACPLLLWLDDLHWADEASLELLHYVARHAAAYPLIIIGTYRPEVVADTPYLERHLSAAGRAPGPSALALTPLDQEAVGQMLMHVGIGWPADLPARLHQHSSGIPFLLVETLYALIESGVLRRGPDGRLVEAVAQSWPLPQRVQDLIHARLAPLDEEQQRVLAAGAVIGRPFGLHLLRRVSGLPELRLLNLVEPLLGRAIFEEKAEMLPGQALDFRHDYFRRVIYAGLSAVQRRALHRRAGRALLALHRTRPKAVVEAVAYHYEQAGDPLAVTYLVQAAQQGEELFAYNHAADLYSRALAVQHSYLAEDLAGRFDLLLAREAVLERQGRRAEQGNDVEELVEIAERLEDAHRLAVACVRQAGFLTYTAQYGEARRAGERALALFRKADDRSGEAQALRELGFLHWSAGDYGTALAYVHEALTLHRRLADMDGEATALHNLAEIQRDLGSPRQALAQYEAALNLHWARQDRRRQGLTLYGMAHAWRQLGDLDQALARYQGALDHCRAAGDRLMTSRVHHALASLRWETGAPDRALEHIQQALGISQEIGYGPGIAHGLIALSDIQARGGHGDVARQHLQEAMTWLRLTEDHAGLAQAQARLGALEKADPQELNVLPAKGWVKTHVTLTEGKVYCEFESPMAQARSKSALLPATDTPGFRER